MSSPSSKRRCIRERQQAGIIDSTGVIGLDLDVLSKCWLFLSIADVHSASLTCSEWKRGIWQSDILWEGLISQKYPSYRGLPEGWCTGGRDEYFRRITLMKSQFAPVRNLAGLPIPLQRKTSGSDLMRRWKPDAIVFMVDVFTGRHQFDDDIPIAEDEPVEEKKQMGPHLPIFSKKIRASAKDLQSHKFETNGEVQLPTHLQREVLEDIVAFYDETTGDSDEGSDRLFGECEGLYIEISYYLEGESVPRCNPITLLSEHHTSDYNPEEFVIYRTDIDSVWLPSHFGWNNSRSVFDERASLQRNKQLARQISKYGNIPIPFDPELQLTLSPPGERSFVEYEDDGDIFENDSENECSVLARIGFHIGEDYHCNFGNLVVPPLLSLWKDASDQMARKSFCTYSSGICKNVPHASKCVNSIGVIGLEVLSRCWMFLSLEDVHSATLTCNEWRNYIWQSAPLWEGLICQKYPSHRDLPEGWCTNGRDEYFRRLTLMKNQFAKVRNLPGLPIPLQGKTSGLDLMQLWKSDAIIFMFDVFTGRHYFDDDLPTADHEPVDQRTRMGPQVPIYSKTITVPYHNDKSGNGMDKKTFQFQDEMQITPEDIVLEAIENFHDDTVGNDNLPLYKRDISGLYVEMSYYVKGGNTPKSEPITLLSEHHTFNVATINEGRGPARVCYQTDVKHIDLPGRHSWNNYNSRHEKRLALSTSRVLTKQICKYGRAPLPFDPKLDLVLSPPGDRSLSRLGGGGMLENDSASKCTIAVLVGFCSGTDLEPNFAEVVVPPLLSLWNDASKQP